MSKQLVDFFTELRLKNIFFTQFDCQFIDVEPGLCKIDFFLDESKLSNMIGNLHGGAYMAMSDCSMGVVGYSLGKKITTLDYNCNFMRSVKATDRIHSLAEVVHNGKRTVVIKNDFYDDQNQLLFTARGTFFIVDSFALPENQIKDI